MNDVTSPADPTSMTVAGADIELFERGSGAPLLFLHGAQGVRPAERFLDLLAAGRRVIAPSHPGFGGSSLPDWLDSVDDIAHIYLELMDRLGVDSVDLIGCSVGGWIAADLATKTPERCSGWCWSGRSASRSGPSTSSTSRTSSQCRRSELERAAVPRSGEAARPTSHARRRAARDRRRATARRSRCSPGSRTCTIPSSGTGCIASPRRRCSCAARATGWCRPNISPAYAALLPNARTDTIAEAGHAPHVEQPEAFAATVLEFLEADAARAGAMP